MSPNPELVEGIKQSFAHQRLLFFGMAIVAALTGIGILALSFVVPAKPGEEGILLALQITSVVFILFAGWSVWYVRSRESRVLRLLFHTPQEIESVKSVTITKSGVHGHAIRVYTKNGRMVGFNVTGGLKDRMMELIKLHLQNEGVVAK